MSEVKIPEVKNVPVEQLKVDGKNPNRMTEAQLSRLKDLILRVGFAVPIVTNKDLLIADGEQRWIVAKKLQMPEVPVIRLPVSEVDRRLIRQTFNKLRGEHDLFADALEFEQIIKAGAEADLKYLLEMSDQKLAKSLSLLKKDFKEEDYLPDYLPTTEIKTGDVWRLGDHLLSCGDSTKKMYVDQLIGKEQIHLLLTDPPYNVGYGGSNVMKGRTSRGDRITSALDQDSLKNPDEDLLRPALQSAVSHLASYNSAYVFYSGMFLANLDSALRHAGAKTIHILVWRKNQVVLGRSDYNFQHELIGYTWFGKHKFYGRQQSSVWDFEKPQVNAIHPTMKPIALLRKAIVNSSRKGENVLDLFGGSGSTLIACEQTGRNCFMQEIAPRYCQVIINRWEAFTGHKAKLEQTLPFKGKPNAENDSATVRSSQTNA